MTSHEAFWEGVYGNASPHPGPPHELAVELADRLEPGSAVLELGCGWGTDSLYFAARGHTVTSCDFAPSALAAFAADAARLGITQRRLDTSQPPYPFATGQFDAVYARLSLHYFPLEVTGAIFAEISRLLRQGGVFLSLHNSVRNPESETGVRLAERYRELAPGRRKRYLTTADADLLARPHFREVTSAYVVTADPGEDRTLVRLAAVR
ncbi:class I SAM-dependent methyltransferase [Actinocrispum sp. NPDC049592]|uniref:class I SAM-dependent methyltransferase n=1 Tax=Actinocrispum sp. NPDC049592 TaxID=3154835 RepID=UPI0034362199